MTQGHCPLDCHPLGRGHRQQGRHTEEAPPWLGRTGWEGRRALLGTVDCSGRGTNRRETRGMCRVASAWLHSGCRGWGAGSAGRSRAKPGGQAPPGGSLCARRMGSDLTPVENPPQESPWLSIRGVRHWAETRGVSPRKDRWGRWGQSWGLQPQHHVPLQAEPLHVSCAHRTPCPASCHSRPEGTSLTDGDPRLGQARSLTAHTWQGRGPSQARSRQSPTPPKTQLPGAVPPLPTQVRAPFLSQASHLKTKTNKNPALFKMCVCVLNVYF